MILIYISHGLGNQLFQYAFGMVLQKKNKEIPILYDTSFLPLKIENRKTWKIKKILKKEFKIASFIDFYKCTKSCPLIYKIFIQNETILNEMREKYFKCKIIKEPEDRSNITLDIVNKFNNFKFDKNKDYYLFGYWENIEYFKGYENYIKNRLKFRHIFTKEEKLKFRKVFETNSVSVHIRRGDYLKQGKNNNFCLCNLEYYQDAMKLIHKKVVNPYFVFFSDDPEYVRKTYKYIKNKLIVTGNKDYIDLQLMSLCKHNICANSTFSFWGAFLNTNSNKIIIAPKIHYYTKNVRWNKIYFPVQKDWLVINNELEQNKKL